MTDNHAEATEYAGLSSKILADAESLLTQGEWHEASEKFWGAAATMVKAVAESRGWLHQGHRELYKVVSGLAQEAARPELVQWFGLAGHLHTNFYEDWMPPDQVQELALQVRGLRAEIATKIEDDG